MWNRFRRTLRRKNPITELLWFTILWFMCFSFPICSGIRHLNDSLLMVYYHDQVVAIGKHFFNGVWMLHELFSSPVVRIQCFWCQFYFLSVSSIVAIHSLSVVTRKSIAFHFILTTSRIILRRNRYHGNQLILFSHLFAVELGPEKLLIGCELIEI